MSAARMNEKRLQGYCAPGDVIQPDDDHRTRLDVSNAPSIGTRQLAMEEC